MEYNDQDIQSIWVVNKDTGIVSKQWGFFKEISLEKYKNSFYYSIF